MCRPAVLPQRRAATTAAAATTPATPATAAAGRTATTTTSAATTTAAAGVRAARAERGRLRERGSPDQRHRVHLTVSALDPTKEQLESLSARPADEPVVMVNLLKFRDGGRDSYVRYAQEAGPHLERVGGAVLYAGEAPAQIIGDDPTPWWDAIVVVRYPSPAAFMAMVSAEDYPHRHRTDALERGDLIATSTWAMDG